MRRKIRVLVGKPGLDGHDRGAKVVAAALRDAGMEVIYSGLHQSAAQIVEAALQEDVDVVALSILSGAHMTLFPEVLNLMKERGIGDKLLSGGGIIPAEDAEKLARMGVGRLFGPGSSTQEIAEYLRLWYAARHGEETPPSPAPPLQVGGRRTRSERPPARGATRPARARSGRSRPAQRSTARPARAPAPRARSRRSTRGSGRTRTATGRRR